MRAVIQRVCSASVSVDDNCVAMVKKGLLVFIGIKDTDESHDCDYLINKIVQMRIFQDELRPMNKNIVDVNGGILLVSQFTLFGDMRKGNRPSFSSAMHPEKALHIYEYFVKQCKKQYPRVKTGVFGAHMHIELVNDGPVTILLDSEKTF